MSNPALSLSEILNVRKDEKTIDALNEQETHRCRECGGIVCVTNNPTPNDPYKDQQKLEREKESHVCMQIA